MTEQSDGSIDTKRDPGTADEFVERMKSRKERYERFRGLFEQRSRHEFAIKVPSIINPEATDTICIYPHVKKPEIIKVDVDRKDPVQFSDPYLSVDFRRYVTPLPEKPKGDDFDGIYFDFSDDEEAQKKDVPTIDYSKEGILKDIEKKCEEADLVDVPVIAYARRLVAEQDDTEETVARMKAKAIVPLYRNLEVKRLTTDPNSHEVSYMQIAQQRQNVYDQLTGLLRKSGLDPKEITEYLMKGLFDAGRIAGIPVMTDEYGNSYIAIDYSVDGYNVENPVGTDFSSRYEARPGSDITEILDTAENLGYETRFYHESIGNSTNPHQRWEWHGIKIDGFDKNDLERNTQKVIKILTDVGIDPQELANPNEEGIDDRFIRQMN